MTNIKMLRAIHKPSDSSDKKELILFSVKYEKHEKSSHLLPNF